MGVNFWPLSVKVGNMPRILEREYLELFTVLLTVMVYGEEDTLRSFIRCDEQDIVK